MKLQKRAGVKGCIAGITPRSHAFVNASNAAIIIPVASEMSYKFSLSALHSMVCNGLGIALLPCYVGDRDAKLRRVDPEPYPESTIELWLLYHPDIRKMQRVQLFAEYIRDQIVKDSDLFEGRRPRIPI